MKYKVRMTAKANTLHDKYNGVTYLTGDEHIFSEERYKELLAGGYVELIEVIEEVKKAVKEPKEVKKAVKKTAKKK